MLVAFSFVAFTIRRHFIDWDAAKRLANERDVPYQSLLKVFLAERLDQELRPSKSR